jgi:cyclophilin family peptidyl-prolyl cis-trans isomerase
MKNCLTPLLAGVLMIAAGTLSAANPQVKMQTSEGDVVIELYPDQAPVSVENFLRYVNDGAYDHTIFHRVIKGFMNQGGGFTSDLQKKPVAYPPIENEADNGLKNRRGTIAMARTSDPNSATNQFFINTVDNSFLDFTSRTPRGWGYAVFGKVVDGMEVMDSIAAVKTGARGPFKSDVPLETVEIISVKEISDSGAKP